MSRFKWVRKVGPTRGVEWSCEDYKITEFQGAYLVSDSKTSKIMTGRVAVLGEEVHKALEVAWQAENGRER